MKKAKGLYQRLNKRLFSVLKIEEGQTMIEYALIAVAIAIVLVLGFKASGVGTGINTAGSKVGSELSK